MAFCHGPRPTCSRVWQAASQPKIRAGSPASGYRCCSRPHLWGEMSSREPSAGATVRESMTGPATANPTNAPSASRIGQLISGRYRVNSLIGEGGMGAVYLAEHTLMRKRFALKLLHPEMANREEVLARF